MLTSAPARSLAALAGVVLTAAAATAGPIDWGYTVTGRTTTGSNLVYLGSVDRYEQYSYPDWSWSSTNWHHDVLGTAAPANLSGSASGFQDLGTVMRPADTFAEQVGGPWGYSSQTGAWGTYPDYSLQQWQQHFTDAELNRGFATDYRLEIQITDAASGVSDTAEFLFRAAGVYGAYGSFTTIYENGDTSGWDYWPGDTPNGWADITFWVPSGDGTLSFDLGGNRYDVTAYSEFGAIRASVDVSPLAPPVAPADVPEPATLAMAGLGLAGLAASRRRCRATV